MTNSTDSQTNDCWNVIGIGGDGSCPELAKVTHCRNCPVFTASSVSLLEREPPAGYRANWTRLLAHRQEDQPTSTKSVVIFRIGDQWLALPTRLFKEITELRVGRRIPHRANQVLRGLANVHGELELYVSMHGLLGVEDPAAMDTIVIEQGRRYYRRLVVVERGGDRWAFPVDEVHGVHRFPEQDLRRAPVTVAKTQNTYTRGVIRWKDQDVGLLDEDLLFMAFQGSVQ